MNLTINTVNAGVTQNNEVLTATATGATYQWIDCKNGNAVISGATNQVYTATANGSYAVIVTQNGCTDTSACFDVNTLGLNTNNFNNAIKVYPNPSNGEVTISSINTLNNASIKVLNALGQVILEIDGINGDEFNFSITDQPYGIYILEINNNGVISTVKIIKN